ncbi:MAG: hypothetical protein QM602_09710 [Microbacterium sp.]
MADEFVGHVPVWFPPPVFDDESQMPISLALIQALRIWNAAGTDRENATATEITEHYRVGLNLAQELADQLGPDYSVQFLTGGASSGWAEIEATSD